MKELQFVFEIHAPEDTVWNTLWSDVTFRDWAGIIDPGTYRVGNLLEGNEVQFISSENGYGVTSIVDKRLGNEYLRLKHIADTKERGTQTREDEWTGGEESYSLVEENDITILTVTIDVPLKMEKYFKTTYPKAFRRVKELAES